MPWIYSLIIGLYGLLIRVVSVWNPKAKRWLSYRKDWSQEVKSIGEKYKNPILIHCASVGEYQQAKPIINELKEQYPHIPIVLSFYSPSGYDQFDKDEKVGAICSLPLDTSSNARKFLSLVNPRLVIIIKYEYWYHLIDQLVIRQIPTYFVAVYIHSRHVLVNPMMGFLRNRLKEIQGIMVQDRSSLEKLEDLGFQNVSITGDSRIEQVINLRTEEYVHTIFEEIRRQRLCLIAGSTHPKDEEILLHLRMTYPDHLMVIAPHEWNPKRLIDLLKDFGPSCVLFTELKSNKQVSTIILDTYGDLKYIYRYATIAYIGGGFDRGVHSLLEPAAYCIPLVFGPSYRKFSEAIDFLELGAAISVSTKEELAGHFMELLEPGYLQETRERLSHYFLKKKANITDMVKILTRSLD